jgi:hypothetical protein
MLKGAHHAMTKNKEQTSGGDPSPTTLNAQYYLGWPPRCVCWRLAHSWGHTEGPSHSKGRNCCVCTSEPVHGCWEEPSNRTIIPMEASGYRHSPCALGLSVFTEERLMTNHGTL